MRMTLQEVKSRCSEGRFFSYEGFHDRFFVPPSIFLVWFFVNLGWSGNAVSWLSGFIAIMGGCFLASNNSVLILIGSFCYMAFYLLDYVDGGVARLQKSGGISGQYIDWIMHVISAVSIFSGIAIGALYQSSAGLWLAPFAILMVVATALQLDRFSLGWWTICMHLQQFKTTNQFPILASGSSDHSFKDERDFASRKSCFLFKILRGGTIRIFHENFAIFIIPFLAIIQCLASSQMRGVIPDFRIFLTVVGGAFYFLSIAYEIVLISKYNRLENAYMKLFFSEQKPDLPRDHFFN